MCAPDGNADTRTFQAPELLGPDHQGFDIPLGISRSELHAVHDDFNAVTRLLLVPRDAIDVARRPVG